MRTLGVDIETFSSVNLQKCGAHKYAESADFQVLLCAYAFDDEPARIAEGIPLDLAFALVDPAVVKTAFNASFERTCLASALGAPMPPEQWDCAAVRARALSLPGSLEAVGRVLGLTEDQAKLKTGRALIRYFCSPCAPTKTNGGRMRNLPEHAPDKWTQFKEYCLRDVEAEREIRRRLSRFPLPDKERALWILDQQINDRGILIDTRLAERAVELDAEAKTALLAEAKDLTGLANPKSVSQIKTWIEDTAGVRVDSLNKKEIAGVRAAADNELVDKFLNIRAGLSKTSTEKYNAMLRSVGQDGRARGVTLFYGATRTGRWAGRLMQTQNLPAISLSAEDLDVARQAARDGDAETLGLLFGDVPDALSQLIRTAIIPAPGHRLIVADFSSIEARVIAWLAGERWRLDVFNTHGKIYEASAEQMFRLPLGSVKKGDPMRQKGKIAELALGFAGGVGALKSMGALSMGLKEDELQPLVNAWRRANPAIVRLWRAVDMAARDTIQTRKPNYLRHGLAFRMDGPLLRMRLPSGRELSYVKPRLDAGNITYEGALSTGGGWGRVETFGGKLTENAVQATARDCLGEAMLRVRWPIVFHVHDEMVLEAPASSAAACLADVLNAMNAPLGWAPELPLKGEGFVTDYYKKE
ncbi:MAG: hypothetical protein LBS11_10525 [Oscillospiraceae bacterium]|jgi:DNA polymerase|nr:hypothetical protein [Oscillospiraceae bacterium]